MEQGLLGFATLLIGLTVGRQPVDLLVAEPIAAVRVELDGREIAELQGPPWRFVLDLGDDPMPHRVEAVGFDAAGGELARATQWANLPRSEVELDLVLERGAAGTPTGARVAWASARPATAPELHAVLDGKPLAITRTDAVSFPKLDASAPHFLRVEADFGHGRVAGKEIGFGGVYSDTGMSALTAIAATLGMGRKQVAAADAAAATRGGEAIRVVAIDAPGARVVLVLDRRAVDALQVATGSSVGAASPGLEVAACRAVAARPRRGNDTLVVLDPRPSVVGHDGLASRLFVGGQVARVRNRDAVGALLHVFVPAGGSTGQSLSNAVATAGLIAAAGGHRRAVVVLLGAADTGGGTISVAAVRRFLQALGVPLRVWWPGAPQGMPESSEWGDLEDVSTCSRLDRAASLLAEEVERQRIVWVEGLHLPQDVVLSSPRLERVR